MVDGKHDAMALFPASADCQRLIPQFWAVLGFRGTHVLLNDPTKGYGILIENTPEAAGNGAN